MPLLLAMRIFGTLLDMARFFVTVTIAAFAALFFVTSNLHQPTMDFNLHCTVYNRVASALGGGCNMTLGGLFTSMTVVAVTMIVILAVAFVVFGSIVPAHCVVVANVQQSPHENLTLLEFYFRGLAPSRKFL